MTRAIPIAVSTGSLYPLPTLECIRHFRGLDIHEVELTLQANEFYLTFERTLSMPIFPDLRNLVREGELSVGSVHAPAIFSAHANNLWARKQYLLYSIEICRLLGASILVLHPLHLFQYQELVLDYLSGNGTRLASVLLPGALEVIETAHSANVTLAMENIQDWVDEPFFNAPENILRFLRDIGHPAFGCTLDLMHAQFPDLLDEFLDSLSTEIVNIHAADLLPPAQRAAPGNGVIDWKRLAPIIQTLPNLRQITIELSKPQGNDIVESVEFLSALLS